MANLCWRHEMLEYQIELTQDGPDDFCVKYGKQVEDHLSYVEACKELGSALMHALACDGKVDNRTVDEFEDGEEPDSFYDEVECHFCHVTKPSVEAAIEADWSPSFFDGESEISDPVCSECSATRLTVGKDGELELRKGSTPPQNPV